MALACPYCQREIVVREAPAPRFKAPCPGCGKLFVVQLALISVEEDVRRRARRGAKVNGPHGRELSKPTTRPARRKRKQPDTVAARLDSAVDPDAPAVGSDFPQQDATAAAGGAPVAPSADESVELPDQVQQDSATAPSVAQTPADVHAAETIDAGQPAVGGSREGDTDGAAAVTQNSSATTGSASPAESPESESDEGSWLEDFLQSEDPIEEDPIDEYDSTGEAAATADHPSRAARDEAEIDDDDGIDLLEQPGDDHTPSGAPHDRGVDLEVTADASAAPSLAGDVDETTDPVATDASPAAESPPAADDTLCLPPTLNGYRLVKPLGHGAMGAVYLAHQLSLNRNVALKVMQPQLAADPYFVARFTREAYAAAQLTHHNVVQIYDMGAARKIRYFSMEFVPGQNLGELLEQKGRLAPREAAGYILQAARGLKFAHDHGMIHRDVKPENLMINSEGIVKVADLGLVKAIADEHWQGDAAGQATAGEGNGAGMTVAQAAMGTPSFMSPEQADDAASVDLRADVYSLGCTLYNLVTGRPPFTGKTVKEVLTKHKSGQFTPPKAAVGSLPDEISEITLQMMARRPAERCQTMGEVISSLQRFLGQAAQHFAPRREHVELLERNLAAFRDVPLGKLRDKLWPAFWVLCAVLLVIGWPLFGAFGVGAALGLAVLTPLAHFVYSGQRTGGYLYLKVREYVIASGPLAWSKGLLTLCLVGAILYFLNWLVPWLLVCGAAIGIAAAIFYWVDRQLAARRAEPLENVAKLIRRFRMRGTDEAELKLFIAEQAGEDWEEFYESLFGYEAKLQMRGQINLPGRAAAAKEHAGWRDGLIQWLDKRIVAQREARDRKVLERVERDKLRAGGLSARKARQRAEEAADAIVDQATQLREASIAGTSDPAQRRQMIKGMLMAARLGGEDKRTWMQKKLDEGGRGVDWALGSSVRGLVGLLLVVGCAAWMDQNGLIPWRPLQELTLEDIREVPPENVRPYAEHLTALTSPPRPLEIAGVPRKWTVLLFGYGSGLAGIVLLLSALMGGRWSLLFILPAAYLLMFGELFFALPELAVPGVLVIPGQWSMWAAGGALALLGLLVGNRESR